ncbi:zf-HC2 domain-containing protein [Streptomyces monticola]|uniref:Zf-HC2 domain-containing protein n=1 Tax=Streptomyces monticola TaxID=2666263 RepID=A0ABW2JUI0_9ACTN
MSGYESQGFRDHQGGESVHDAVGAYALGILDGAEATAFERHLARCDSCARELAELSPMEPMLAALAGREEPGPSPSSTPSLPRRPQPLSQSQSQSASQSQSQSQSQAQSQSLSPSQPSPRLLGGLVDEVERRRAAGRRRTLYLVAAAAALIVGGPLAVMAATGGDDGTRTPEAHETSPAKDAFFHHMEEKVAATDSATDVTATVGMEKKPWGTHTVLELKNVKGPLKCSLVAVGKDGERETVTSWSVPKSGYGIENSPDKWSRSPLYVHGGAALDRNDIDHFEVRTVDGRSLVEVDA